MIVMIPTAQAMARREGRMAEAVRGVVSQLRLGLWRRGTAICWRSTGNSASFDAAERAGSALQPARRTNMRESVGRGPARDAASRPAYARFGPPQALLSRPGQPRRMGDQGRPGPGLS